MWIATIRCVYSSVYLPLPFCLVPLHPNVRTRRVPAIQIGFRDSTYSTDGMTSPYTCKIYFPQMTSSVSQAQLSIISTSGVSRAAYRVRTRYTTLGRAHSRLLPRTAGLAGPMCDLSLGTPCYLPCSQKQSTAASALAPRLDLSQCATQDRRACVGLGAPDKGSRSC